MSIRRTIETSPRRVIGCGLLLAGLATGAPACPQVADLAKTSCVQLLDLPRNDRGQLIVWLHGYYAGVAQRAMIDRTKLEDTVSAIQQACERNRSMPLIGSEARAIFLGDPAPQPPPAPAAPAPVSDRAGPRPRPR